MVRVVIRPCPRSVAECATATWSRAAHPGHRTRPCGSPSPARRTPPGLMDELGGGLHRMQGIGGHTVSFRSICPSTAVAIGTSFVLTPTSAWAATTEHCAVPPPASQQMPLVTLSVPSAPHRLTIQPDRHQLRQIDLVGACARNVTLAPRLAEQAAHQPAAHRSVERVSIGVGDHPPDRRLRRRPGRPRRPADTGPPAPGRNVFDPRRSP